MFFSIFFETHKYDFEFFKLTRSSGAREQEIFGFYIFFGLTMGDFGSFTAGLLGYRY
jgi:hypothetical protein